MLVLFNYRLSGVRSSSSRSRVGVFLDFQCFAMASVARESHWISSRNSPRTLEEKYLTPLGGGCPNGLSRPALTKMGMSCRPKPRNHAVSCESNLAGITPVTLRKSFRWGVIIQLIVRIDRYEFNLVHSDCVLMSFRFHRFENIFLSLRAGGLLHQKSVCGKLIPSAGQPYARPSKISVGLARCCRSGLWVYVHCSDG